MSTNTEKLIKKNRHMLASHVHLIVVYIITLAFISYYTALSFLRYDNFYTGRYDLGNMTQTVWNTAHGRIFMFTNPDGTEEVSRLAFHADFIMILFAPLYWIWDSPKVLLLIQAIVVGIGGIFIYLLSYTIVRNKNLAVVFALAYFINPALSWSVLFDFHPVVLATSLLLGSVYFLIKKRYVWFVIFSFFAALTKEQVWLTVAIFGPMLFFTQQKRIFGFLIFTVSIGLFYWLIWHAIPNASSSQGHFALSYFEESDNSPTQLILGAVKNPFETLSTLFQKDRVDYLRALFVPLGFLSLLYPFWLSFIPGDFVLNLLSDKEELHQIYYHYTATITPFIFIAAMYGVMVIKKLLKDYFPDAVINIALVIYIFIMSLYSAYMYGPLLGTLKPNDEMVNNQVEHKSEIQAQLDKIPVDSSVAASNEIGAQLSHRRNIYTLGIDVTDADYVAFFTHDPDPGELQYNNELIGQLSQNPEYSLWYDKYDLRIFKKSN